MRALTSFFGLGILSVLVSCSPETAIGQTSGQVGVQTSTSASAGSQYSGHAGGYATGRAPGYGDQDLSRAGLVRTTYQYDRNSDSEYALFGAGCFWGIESAFRKEDGVIATAVGYSGGHKLNPTYEEVCAGVTRHAEVILIQFDPNVVNYYDLLQVFFELHDPTQMNRQGADIGDQYRSAVFAFSDQQMSLARRKIEELDAKKVLHRPIVTEVTPATTFWKAEEYHQQYIEKGGRWICASSKRVER